VFKGMNDGPQQQQESNSLNDKETHQIGQKKHDIVYWAFFSFA
jgi:hypothetical protein